MNYQIFLSYDTSTHQLKETNGLIGGSPEPDNTVTVEHGDSIEWLLAPNSNIATIDNIFSDIDALFSNPPGHNNGFIAEISPDCPTGLHHYEIQITLFGGGKPLKPIDPKIRVNGHQ